MDWHGKSWRFWYRNSLSIWSSIGNCFRVKIYHFFFFFYRLKFFFVKNKKKIQIYSWLSKPFQFDFSADSKLDSLAPLDGIYHLTAEARLKSGSAFDEARAKAKITSIAVCFFYKWENFFECFFSLKIWELCSILVSLRFMFMFVDLDLKLRLNHQQVNKINQH